MKKVVPIIFIALLLIVPTIFALNLEVKKLSANEAAVIGLEKPAIVNLQIKNRGDSENLIFYTFFTPTFFPKGTTPIAQGETANVNLEIYPPESLKFSGHQTFEYYIRSQDGSEMTQILTLNFVELKDAFEIGSGEVNVASSTMIIYIHNKINFKFENLEVDFSSPFFGLNDKITLEPNQKKEFTVQLNKEDFNKLMAGYYTMNTEVKIGKLKSELEAPIKFVERDILTETKKDYGLIINTKIITKTNEGNVLSNTETLIKKNIFSRLFTTFSPEPDKVERQGFGIYYIWNQEIKPGESYEIKVQTNWLFPFILILLLVAIAGTTRYYSTRNLVLKKRVSFVRTKGGEFALKVSVVIKAKKYLEKVNIMERLPPLVKLHEKFGVEVPSRIDEKNRRIEWRFNKLEEGETRIINYIMYSKIGVVGKFALPRTTALFEKEGKILERNSNKTFFVIEQNGREFE